MTHLLDTDTCIGVLRQKPGMVEKLSRLAPADVAISMVTVYELFCGVEKAGNPAKERGKVERFISAIAELPLERAAAQMAAQVRAELERQGTVIGPYDLLIAGQALAGNLTLVTGNVAEFRRVQGLKIEPWP
ncbi:MAG TPA: type II toxin-antitoxin system VapC family toxin [Candidatus Sulfotelmatobacter sp.]|jgi:tRNA(fMet)-specific endonuclease VapC|nr:type II toxin-antitoxin system VapC family toxin [Candidatus Sulfotelmatobacter sp.]